MKIYGRLPAQEISALLADSLVGVANYSYTLRAKSGVVAAYQAHGVPTVLFPPLGETSAGKLSDECLNVAQIFATPHAMLNELLKSTSEAGFADYQQSRSFNASAKKIEQLLWK